MQPEVIRQWSSRGYVDESGQRHRLTGHRVRDQHGIRKLYDELEVLKMEKEMRMRRNANRSCVERPRGSQ